MTVLARVWSAIRSRPRESGAASLALLVAIGGLALSVPGSDMGSGWPRATVREGTFVDAVVEMGEVNAARLMLYSAPVGSAQSKIVSIVPEGASVQTGDELVRFDDTTIRQSIERERAVLGREEAELLRTREDLRIERLRVQAELESTTLAVRFAERELTNQMEGQGRLSVVEAEAAAAEARRERDRAKTSYEDTRALLPEGFVTRVEVERAEQDYRRAEERVELADLRLETLTNYERPGTIDRSMAAVNAAHEGLRRSEETTTARLAQRQAALAAAQSRVDEARTRLATLEDRLNRTVVLSDGAGLVVYRDLYFGGDRRKPQVGDEVWPNQPLIALPDSTQLVVETRVREIDLHKVSESQRVQVRFDAYPDIELPASVALVGALAQDDETRAGTKYFPVTVKLLEVDDRLRTGMTARVEIEVASKDHAKLIPIEALFGSEDVLYVLVPAHGSVERRPVTVDATNALVAALASGPEIGEDVLLVDPTRPSAEAKP